ncbi:hypothetical protein CsSME_00041161 [Camellia sinensis var. sinensis]
MTSSLTLSAVDSIQASLSEICATDDDHSYCWENPRRFSGYAKRLRSVLNQLLRSSSSPENLPPSVQTSLKGTSADLTKAAEILSVYRNKSKIFVLINCQSLSSSLQDHTVAIGGWLSLLDSALPEIPDLRKKVSDLSRDMKQAQFRKIMLEEGITRSAIHSLIGSSEKEREYAVRLLLEFSKDKAYCANIASEKGALVLLSSMAGNLECPALSNLAEEVLKRMETVEDNVQHLAAAGRFEPLLSRLCEGMFYTNCLLLLLIINC